jgi:uncharacterized protein (DUF2236 family)
LRHTRSVKRPREPLVSRKINGEILVLLGWAPAILLQVAHPLVAAGVAEHSSFRAAPGERARRLRATVGAMLALTFGDPRAVEDAASGINRIHDRVHGRLDRAVGPFTAGTAYSAHDPELLRWVHATLLLTLPRAFELYVGPLTAVERDGYCAEATGLGPLLGVPQDRLPASVAELEHYVVGMLASGRIRVGDTARALAAELLHPPVPQAAEPLLALMRLPAVGLLPAGVRREYGFAWGPRHAAALRGSATLLRGTRALLPDALRRWPIAGRAARVLGRSGAGRP